jgi:hypothetical protein
VGEEELAGAHYWLALIELHPMWSGSTQDLILWPALKLSNTKATQPQREAEAAARSRFELIRKLPLSPAAAVWKELAQEWLAALHCARVFELSATEGLSAAKKEYETALTLFKELSATQPCNAALLRARFHYYLLRIAVEQKFGDADVKALWVALNADEQLDPAAAAENPLRDLPKLIEFNSIHYRARGLQLPAVNCPDAAAAQPFLDRLMLLASVRDWFGVSSHSTILTLERTGQELAFDAALIGDDNTVRSSLSAQAYRIQKYVDPQLDQQSRVIATTPYLSGRSRDFLATQIIDELTDRKKKDGTAYADKPQQWMEKALLADQMFDQAIVILERDADAESKKLAAAIRKDRDKFREHWLQHVEKAASNIVKDEPEKAKMWRAYAATRQPKKQ